jgi:tetratricopeptide (TPR) repeat protein
VSESPPDSTPANPAPEPSPAGGAQTGTQTGSVAWVVGFLVVGFLGALALQGRSPDPEPGASASASAPDDPQALEASAKGLPPAEALPLVRRAAGLAPEDAALQLRLGNLYVTLRRHGEALTPLERAVRAAEAGSPLEGQAQLALGKALTELGRGKEARGPLQRAAFLRPDDPSVDYFLGMGALLTGERELQIKHLGRFAQRGERPDQLVVALQVLADAHEAKGEADLALAALQRVADLDRRNVVARALVARRRAALRGLPEALAAARAAARAPGADAGAHYALGSLYADWPGPGHGAAAIAAFGSAANLAPRDRAATLARARELARGGQLPEARGLLLRGLQQNPADAVINLTLADFERAAGDHGAARGRLDGLVQSPELPPRLRGAVEFSLLASLLDEGRDDVARQLLQRYAKLPARDMRREALATGLTRLGAFEDAARVLGGLAEATSSPQRKAAFRTRRAQVLLAAGQGPAAWKELEAVLGELGLEQLPVELALWAGVARVEEATVEAQGYWKRGVKGGPRAGPSAWKTWTCAFLAGEVSLSEARAALRLADFDERNDAAFLLGLGLAQRGDRAGAEAEWRRGLKLSARGEFPQRLLERALTK